MSELRSHLSDLHETWRDPDARPPDGLLEGIAHARRNRAGLWGLGSVVAIGLVVAAALPGAMGVGESAPGMPEAMPTIVPPIYERASVAFADAAWFDNPLATGPPQCGEPLPSPLSARDGLSASHAVPDAVRVDRGGYLAGVAASVAIRYGAVDDLPAAMGPMVGLVASDGEVVGWLPTTSRRGLSRFTDGASFSVSWSGLGGPPIACRDSADERLERLEAGSYEVAWVTRVEANEDENARADLSLRGWTIPPAEYLTAYRAGSYECEEALERTGTTPLTCDPGAVPGTEIDIDAGEITFPYRADALGRDIDVTFVSRAVPLTVEDDSASPLSIIERENPAHVPGEPMQCGAQYGDLERSALALRWDEPFEHLDRRQTVEATAWLRGFSWDEATLALPDTARLWITQQVQRRAALNDGGSYAYVVHRVVGWAHVGLPAQVTIDRYAGPAPFTVDVGAVEWCESPPQVSEAALTYSIVAPHSVTRDGAVDQWELVEVE